MIEVADELVVAPTEVFVLSDQGVIAGDELPVPPFAFVVERQPESGDEHLKVFVVLLRVLFHLAHQLAALVDLVP